DISTGGLGMPASLKLDTCEQQPTPSTPIVKACDPIGILRVRISPPQGPANPQTHLGPFVYAIALDGTVRVVSAGNFRECEAAADAQLVAQRFPMLTSVLDPYSGVTADQRYTPDCLPTDEDSLALDPNALRIRRAVANGPGIRPSG